MSDDMASRAERAHHEQLQYEEELATIVKETKRLQKLVRRGGRGGGRREKVLSPEYTFYYFRYLLKYQRNTVAGPFTSSEKLTKYNRL